ncbi:MAG: serine/threonine protein kinase [Planctomycetes bacterium]|nr:serine/threonine protein kinase [Planctomycetota bacterium]
MESTTRPRDPDRDLAARRELQAALLDRLVGEYADRVAAGRADATADLLAAVGPDEQPELRRLFALIAATDGIAGASGGGAAPLLPGTVLGGCKLIEELGRGGMASVWRAEQLELKRAVAVKVLRPGLALDPRQADRFRREALAIARLDHPGIVRVHAVGAERGQLYLVMELIEGRTLAQALQALPPVAERTAASFAHALAPQVRESATSKADVARGVLGYERAVARLFAAIARAVAAAHARGVVHRDLKPSNVLLRRDGAPVVADFGLAKGDGDLARSLTGEPVGTPWYMSPEQVEQSSASIDARTDVWSLGVMLYEALCGARPFDGPTTIALFDKIRHQLPPLLQARAPGCSRDAEAVVAKALARDRDERYASADALAEDLEALASGRAVAAARCGTSARRGVRVAIGAVAARPAARPREVRRAAATGDCARLVRDRQSGDRDRRVRRHRGGSDCARRRRARRGGDRRPRDRRRCLRRPRDRRGRDRRQGDRLVRARRQRHRPARLDRAGR